MSDRRFWCAATSTALPRAAPAPNTARCRRACSAAAHPSSRTTHAALRRGRRSICGRERHEHRDLCRPLAVPSSRRPASSHAESRRRRRALCSPGRGLLCPIACGTARRRQRRRRAAPDSRRAHPSPRSAGSSALQRPSTRSTHRRARAAPPLTADPRPASSSPCAGGCRAWPRRRARTSRCG